MTREPGFYWLRAEDGTWTVGECENNRDWSVIGTDCGFREGGGILYGSGYGTRSRERYTIGPRIEPPGEEGKP